ncbi:MAG: PAS domain-containing protein, partial [Thermoleophilia bacterium]|nr:PAS domain-containing protein [Thermoleophilia bacterium]
MAIIPIDRESPFDVSELFFSVTDRKGIILAGNDVFVRVSRHPEAELIGSPHNIIRHPDMPRAAFRLLWDHLLRGLPIAAYVKNMAADGSYYWVMACVVPCGDGFLSVRLKPTSELLTAAVIPVYAEVRAMEIRMEQAGTPRREVAERSCERLLEMLADAGFPDYGSFIRMALPQEIRAREAALGRGGEHVAGARGVA